MLLVLYVSLGFNMMIPLYSVRSFLSFLANSDVPRLYSPVPFQNSSLHTAEVSSLSIDFIILDFLMSAFLYLFILEKGVLELCFYHNELI